MARWLRHAIDEFRRYRRWVSQVAARARLGLLVTVATIAAVSMVALVFVSPSARSLGGKPPKAASLTAGASKALSPTTPTPRTSSAGGYWLVGSDGGVFAFGDAGFFGSLGGRVLVARVVGAASESVKTPGPLQVVTSSLPPALSGEAYSATLLAAGGSPPYTWSIKSGTLPSGLSLGGATGVISGIPAGSTVAPLTIAVTDEHGGLATTILTLMVGLTPGQVGPGQGTLDVIVGQLPPGLPTSVSIAGPGGFATQLTAGGDMEVSPGVYTVSASPVTDGASTYYPTVTGSPATVVAGQPTVVGVSYLITVPATTKVLSASDVADLTSASSDQSSLTFSWTGDEPADLAALQDGDVLTAAPTTSLPAGLLVKITSMAVEGSTLVVTTAHAGLVQAVSQGEFDVTGSTEPLTSAQLGALVSHHVLRPNGSSSAGCLADGSVSLQLTSPQFSITPHFDASWSLNSGFQADAYITVVESVAYQAKINGGIACQYTYAIVPKSPLTDIPIPLGPVTIVITPVIEVDLTAKAEADATFTESGTQGFTWQVGASYAGGQLAGISNLTPQNNPNPTTSQATGYFKVALGPKLTFNIGLTPWIPKMPLIGPYIGIDGFLKLQVGQSAPSWAVAFGLEATLGFQASWSFGVFSIGLNAQLTIPIVTVTIAASAPVAKDPPSCPASQPGCSGFVLPTIETGTLLQPYNYQLQAQGYTGSGSSITSGFNLPSGSIKAAIGGNACSANAPAGTSISLTSGGQPPNDALLTVSGLPLDFAAGYLYIPITLTDVLGNVSDLCLSAPVVPGVHSASFPLPPTEADTPYNYQQIVSHGLPVGATYGYDIPMTAGNQGGNGKTYVCPNYPLSTSEQPESPYTLQPVGSGPQYLWAAPTLQISTVTQGSASVCQVNGWVEQNYVPGETADPSVFVGATTQQLQVNDGTTTTDCWGSGNPCDLLVLPPVAQHVFPLLSSTLVGEQGVPFYFAPQVQGGQAPYTWSPTAPNTSQAFEPPNNVQASFDGCYFSITGEGLPPGVAMSDTSTGTLSGTPTSAGTYNVPITISDGFSGTSCEYQQIKVLPALSLSPGALPAAEVRGAYSTGLISTFVTGGQGPYHYSVGGAIPGAPLPGNSFEELPPGLSLDANTGFITGSVASGTPPGTYDVPVVVSDDFDVRAAATVQVTVTPSPQITSPDILSPAAAGKIYSGVQLAASGGTPGYTWSIVSGGLPAGIGLLGDGSLIGVPCSGLGAPASSCPGAAHTSSALVEATDTVGGSVTKYVTIPVGPAITTRSLPRGELGVQYQAALDAQGGTAPYTWRILGTHVLVSSSLGTLHWVTLPVPLPPGLALATTSSNAARSLQGRPLRAGTYDIVVQLRDSSGASWNAFLLLVVQVRPAVIAQLPTADVGVSYSAILQATGGVIPFGWTPASVDGLSLANDGTLSGTPLRSGQYSLSAGFTDHNGVSAQASIPLTVVAGPSVVTTSLPVAAYDVPYAVTLKATGGTQRTGAANSLGTCAVAASSGPVTGSPGTATSGCTAAGSSLAGPYLWSLAPGDNLPAGLSFDPETGTISGTPVQSVAGTSTPLHVTATDSWNAQAAVTLTLSVALPLVLSTSDLPEGEEKVPYSVTLGAAGGSGPYTWSGGSLPGGLSVDSSSGTISGAPQQSGPFNQVSLCVSDQTGAQACKTFSVTVAAALGVSTATLPGAQEGKAYTPFTLLAAGGVPGYTWSVAEASASGYPLPGWLSVSSGGVITGMPPGSAIGKTYSVPVQVTDSLGGTASASLTLSMGGPIEISTSTLPAGEVNRPYQATIQPAGGVPFSSQGQGQYYEWFLPAGSLPPGLSLDSTTGQITGTVEANGTAIYNFTVEVEDSLSDTASADLSIAVDIAPSVGTQGLPPAPVGSAYSTQLTANDGVTPYIWSLATGSSLPTWLTLSGSGLLSGTPSASDVGQTSFSVEVADAAGGTAIQALSVKVTPAGLVITTPTTLPDATPGQAYSDALSTSGGYPPYDWYVVSSLLPAWLQLSYTSGTYSLTGTPPQSDAGTTDTFILEVEDSYLTFVSATFTLKVSAPTLAITTASPLPAATGSQYYYQTLAAGGGNGSYTWLVPSGSTLPAWLSLSAGGVLSGTPPDSVAGTTLNVPVEVADTEPTPQQATLTFSLSIVAGQLTITTTSPLPGATAGAAFSSTLAATGGNGSYTWSVPAGNTLPAWLSLSAGGVLSGTPPDSVAGTTLSVTVEVADTETPPQDTTATLSLPVVAAPPVITTTSPLPGATVEMAYSETLTATGGTTPYTWLYPVESFHPSWLALSSAGVLSGTPPATAGGKSFTVDVQVTDATGASTKGTFSLAVRSGVSVSATTVSGSEGAAFSGTVAMFTDSDTSLTSVDFTTVIDWGDGTTTPGSVTGSAGSFTLDGNHTYADEGSYSVTVTVTDSTGASASSISSATVTDEALSGTPVALTAIAGQSFSGPVAGFTDANLGAATTDFTAVIDWGDGSTTAGTVSAGGTGAFDVSGTHSYIKAGSYTISSTITDDGGQSTTATESVTVSTPVSSGTPVCGTISTSTTWNASGSPYEICSSGVTISGALTIDASGGPVAVVSSAGGAISATGSGASIATQGTTAAGQVTFGPGSSASWPGIAAGSGASVRLDDATVADAATGVYAISASNLALVDSTIDSSSEYGVFASSTPVSITGGAISHSGQEGVYEASSALTVSGTAVSYSVDQGVYVYAPSSVSVMSVTVDHAGASGIYVYYPSSGAVVSIKNNTVTNSGSGSSASPCGSRPCGAIELDGITAAIGSDVAGNTGDNNAYEALVFSGTDTASFDWLTPSLNATSTPSALGYAIDGTLTLSGPVTLTVPAGGVVQASGQLVFDGASLDGTAGGAVFTSLSDTTVGIGVCSYYASSGCSSPHPQAGDWEGIVIEADSSGHKGSAALNGATIRYALTGININSGATTAPGGATTGLALVDSTIDSSSEYGVFASSTPVSITGGAISHSGQEGVYEASSALTMSCELVTGNHGGVVASSDGSSAQSVSISQSDLYGNVVVASTYDLSIEGPTGSVVVGHNWWGQTGGPTSAQISPAGFTDSSPLSAPSTCAPTGP